MSRTFRRRTFLVNKSNQVTYIIFSVVPAMVMTIFCVYFIFNNSELILRDSREKPMVPIYNLQQSVANLDMDSCSDEHRTEIVSIKKELGILAQNLESSSEETIHHWNETRRGLYLVMVAFLFCVGLWAFIYSHRVAGPIYRIKKNIDELTRGEDIPPVILRKHDDFKDLAASLEKLRLKIQEMKNAKE